MSRTRRTARRRTGPALATATAAALLAACSGGGSGTTATAAGSAGAASSDLAAKVAALQQAGDSYPVPTEPLEDVAALAGSTVYYVPITQQSPQFAVTETALRAALTTAGVSLEVCNGNATPTGVAACLTQATKAKAGAIVTDAIPYALAANAFDAAIAAGIPVLDTNQSADVEPEAAQYLGLVPAASSDQMAAVADWIIADSGGTADVIINQSTDGPSAAAFVEAAQAEFTAQCPECTVTINEVSSASFSLIPSSTSSALLRNPDAGYVVTEFAQYLQPTQAGVQQAGRTASVKGVSGSTQVAGLEQLAGDDFLYAAAGQASAFQGWVDADAVLRMMSGTSGADLPEYTIPIRLFTRDSIDDVDVTDAAEASGEWFGPTDFTDDFTALWGLA